MAFLLLVEMTQTQMHAFLLKTSGCLSEGFICTVFVKSIDDVFVLICKSLLGSFTGSDKVGVGTYI